MNYSTRGEQRAIEDLYQKVIPALSSWIALYDSGEEWHLTRSLIALAKAAEVLGDDTEALDEFLRQRGKSKSKPRRNTYGF